MKNKTLVYLTVCVEIEHSNRRVLADAIKEARNDVLQWSTGSVGYRGCYSTKPLTATVQELQ